GNDVADLDLGIARTGIVALLAERGIAPERQSKAERDCGRQTPAVAPHLRLPGEPPLRTGSPTPPRSAVFRLAPPSHRYGGGWVRQIPQQPLFPRNFAAVSR